MIKTKKTKFLILFIVITSVIFSSCLTTKTSVGTFNETRGEEYTYAKGKQMWLFWGLVPLGRTDVETPENGNCEIVTRFRFGDVLVSTLSGGIVTSYTIKVRTKRN